MNTLDFSTAPQAGTYQPAPLMNPPSEQFRRAVKLHQQGDLAMAEFMYRQILREEPDYIEVVYLLGLLANQTGRPAEAIEKITRYLQVHPDDAQAISILGLCYFDMQDYARCVLMLEQSLEMKPGVVHTMQNLAKAQFQMKDYAAARHTHEQVLTLLGNDIEALIGMALCDRELGNYEPALGLLEHAIVQEPRRAESHFFYGNVLRDVKDFQGAIDAYGTAIALKSDYLEAYANCASCLKDLGMTSEAMVFYDSALMLDPSHAEANYNRALLLLNELKLEEGWRAYERRLDSETSIRKFMGGRISVAPNWDGYSQPEALLVIGEQGLGDQIFFGEMLADLAKQVPNATVCIEPRLIPLFSRSFPSLKFIGPSEVYTQPFDAQIQLGSLGRLYRNNQAALGNVVSPYLHANTARSTQLNIQLKQENRLLCGISWNSKNADHGEGKSLTLEALLPVLTTPGVDFVDLQYGDTEGERAALQAKHGVHLYRKADIDTHDDIDGLASLIDACDIVVTVSNTTAHLAAALGKPTIVMLPNDDALFWYWHRNSVTTPWYPTVRLFRRSDTGRWEDVIDSVALTLAGIQ